MRSGGAAVEGRGSDLYDAFSALEGALPGETPNLLACGSCRYFHQTGLSRQMSGGGKGYCVLYSASHGRSLQDAVSIFDFCDAFEYGPKQYMRELNERWKRGSRKRPEDASPRSADEQE